MARITASFNKITLHSWAESNANMDLGSFEKE
jgi:hypothetical protein